MPLTLLPQADKRLLHCFGLVRDSAPTFVLFIFSRRVLFQVLTPQLPSFRITTFSCSLLDHFTRRCLCCFAATHSRVNPPRAVFMPRYDTLPIKVEESRPPAWPTYIGDNTPRAYDVYYPLLTLYHIKNNPPLSIYCLFSCCDERDVEHPLENRVLFLCIFCLTLFLAFSSYIAFSCIPSTPILLNTSRAFSCIAACCFIQPYVFTPDPEPSC